MVSSSNSDITLDHLRVQDYIGFTQDATLMALIKGEKLFFADKIKKTNMFNWTQTRTFVVTEQAIYNIHSKQIKRKILVKDIGGLSKTVPPSKALEFVVHVPIAYDYRFTSTRRDDIIDLLKRLYIITHGKNMVMFGMTTKDLESFTTTENDMKKGFSRFPPAEYRNVAEDLLMAS